MQLNPDWIWLMDDDGYPDPSALENLCKAVNENPFPNSRVFAWNSLVIDPQDSNQLSFGYPKFSQLGEIVLGSSIRSRLELRQESIKFDGYYPWGSFFNGSMISKQAVESVGNVNPDYFIWGDETDFHMRIRSQGAIFTVLDSLHFHPSPVQNSMPNWKIFYALRNGIRNSRLYFPNPYLRIMRLCGKYVPKLLLRGEFRLCRKALREGFQSRIQSWNLSP
jgi:GT2 family glycosyltransferase